MERVGSRHFAHGGFRHDALIYRDADEFLSGAMPFLRAGLEAGEPVLVAVARARRELLESELRGDADYVRFAPVEEVAQNPAGIIPLWKDFVEEGGGRSVRGVGEAVWPGRDEAAVEECQRHEALLNVAFAPRPSWSLLCPFDASALPERTIEAVAASHRLIWREGRVEESPLSFEAERDALAGELPPPRAPAEAVRFGLDGLAEVRRRVRRTAEAAGLGADATDGLVTAASELAANSVMHGGGSGELRLWREGDRLLVEVTDQGRIDQPLAGRLRPGLTQEGGRGLWLANRLCDLVQIRSGTDGTTVRLHVLA